jgi:chemotaxis protein CheZ
MADEHFDLSPSAAPPPTEADYDAILAAVMETMRGRWFLAEYAQRNRTADTRLVLSAIARVEEKLQEARPAAPAAPADRLRLDLVEMATAIAKTRSEIASIKPEGDHKGSLTEASEELDSIVHATERATSDILAAAEQVQEIAWTLREHGIDAEACDALDRRSADIYTACSFQDLTGQRTRKVVEVLRFLEQRINAMIDIWGDTIPASEAQSNRPPVPHIHDAPGAEHLDQPHVDEIMPSGAAAAPRPAPPQPPENPAADAAQAASPAPEAAVPQTEHATAEPAEPAPPDPDAAASDATRPAESPPSATPATIAAVVSDEAVAPAEGTPAEASVPSVAVMGAAAAESFAPEVAPAKEPVSTAQDESGPAAGSDRTNPAAVLERILAIIHEPIESAPDDESFAASSSTWPPTTAPSRSDGTMPSVTLERAAGPTQAPTRMPAPPAPPTPPGSIETIPFTGYSRPGKLPVMDPMDDIFELPAQVDFAAMPPAAARPVAMSDTSPSPDATAPPSPVAMPQPPAAADQIAKPEPLVQAVLTEERTAADRAGPRVIEAAQRPPAQRPPAPPARPEPAPAAQPSAVIDPGPPAEPTRLTVSLPRPSPAPEQRPVPLRPVPEPANLAPSDRPAPTNAAASVATPPVVEPVGAPAPRVATTSRPALPPRADVLAAFTALSDDEKIALFS